MKTFVVIAVLFLFVPFISHAAVSCGTGEIVQHNPAVTHFVPPHFTGTFPHITFVPGHIVVDVPASDSCVPDPSYVAPTTPTTPSAPVLGHVVKHRPGSSLNCKAVGKVFMNDAQGTGCRLPVPEHPACFYLNALATNGASYCTGTSADTNWLSEEFKQAVLSLYAKLGH